MMLEGLRVSRGGAAPLYRQVADALESRIRGGALAPGDRLPRETELAETLHVHRMTVRQALGELSRRGLIRTVHGRGSYVQAAPIRHDISGDREASLTLAMRKQGRSVRQQLLRAGRDDDPDARRELGTRGRLRRVDLLRLVDDLPWTVSRVWLAERRFAGLEERWRGDASLYEVLERHYGVRMRRAHRTLWTEPAGPADAEHLDVTVGSPLLIMRGLNVTTEGDPVAVVEHRGRGDRVQFTVSLR